jgi:alanyl-tRNA synthetase
VGDFDLSPCSGTHVRNAAEIGVIFITGFEKLSQTIKVSFLCGDRVRKNYKHHSGILKTLSRNLTTSLELLPDSVTKLQSQIKELRKEISQLKEENLKEEAGKLASEAREWNGNRLIVAVWDRPYHEVRFLAQKLVEYPNRIGALASKEENRIVFFKHRNCPVDLKILFQEFLTRTSAKGGGPPHFMEAGGFQISGSPESLLEDLFSKMTSA